MTSLAKEIPEAESFNVTLKLYDINGEYAEKEIETADVIYDVTDSKTVNKKKKNGFQKTEMQIDGNTHDVLERKVVKKVHAFPRNSNNQPLIPLGSARGYITGTLVAVARTVGTRQGQKLYGILSWMGNGGVKISPHWVAAKVGEVKTANYFVKEAKQSIYYEHIPETEVTVTITVLPRDGFDTQLVKKLLKMAAGIGISPKRRGRFEVVGFS